MAERGVKAGRGNRYGSSAYINRLEAEDARLSTSVRYGRYCISPGDSQLFNYNARDTGPMALANVIYLWFFGGIDADFSLTRAKLRITAALASGVVKTAIYRYSKDPIQELFLVSGSEAKFPTDTTGLKTVIINKTEDGTYPSLRAGGQYYFAAIASDVGTIQFSRFDLGTNATSRQRAESSTDFIKRLPISITSGTSGRYFPDVLYQSSDGAEIL